MTVYKDNYAAIKWTVIDKSHKGVDNTPAKRSRFAAPAVIGDYAAYECPVTGKIIDGRRAHAENLKATGCRVLEPGEKEHNERTRVRNAAAEDKRRDAAIDGIVESVANEYFR